MNPRIKEVLTESIFVKQSLLSNEELLDTLNKVIDTTIIALKADRKVLFCGNGGSAADAQHLASELSGKLYLDRPALFAEALHVNSSATTAIANDYGYDQIFSRQIEAKGQQGDVLYALSTSGNSPNILNAIEAAKKKFMVVIGMTNAEGGKMKNRCDYLLQMPTLDTPRCQEAHIVLGHIICELVEAAMFPKN